MRQLYVGSNGLTPAALASLQKPVEQRQLERLLTKKGKVEADVGADALVSLMKLMLTDARCPPAHDVSAAVL